MKIGVKLGISYAVLIAIIITMGLFANSNLSNLNDNVDKLVKDRFPKTVWANTIIDQLNFGAITLRDAFFIQDPIQRRAAIEKSTSNTKIITENLDSLKATIKSEKGKELLDKIGETRTKTLETRKILMDLEKKGDVQGAIAVLTGEYRNIQTEYMKNVNNLIDFQTELMNQSGKEAEEQYESSSTMILLLLGISVVLALIILFVITSNLKKPINKALLAAEGIADGNMNVDMDSNSKDEIGMLLQAMKKMKDNISRLVGELNRMSNAAVDGKLDARADVNSFKGEYKNIMQGFNNTLDAVIGPLNVTAEYVDRISKGDIPPRIIDNYNGDFNEIKNNLNQLIDTMNGFIGEMMNMSKQHDLGFISVNMNEAKFVGLFRDMAKGVNDMVAGHIKVKKMAMACIAEYGKGNFSEKLVRLPNEKAFINDTLDNLQANLIKVTDEVATLIQAAIDGKLDTRGNSSIYTGDWKKLIEGLNRLIDSIVGPLNVAAEYVDRIAKGDIPPKITDNYNGDFNEIKNNLNQCIDAVNLMVSDAKVLAKAAVDGRLQTRADAMKHHGDFRVIVQGVNDTLDAVIGPLNVAADYVNNISKGNIPAKITDNYNGDFNTIKNNLNTCIDAVNLLVSDANMLSKAAVDGKLDTRADASKHNGDFRLIVQGVNNTLDAVIGPLNVAAEYVDRISKGDIPPKITDNYNGDFNEIKNNLNTCIDAVGMLVADANMLANAAVEGRLQTRAEAARHQGDFRKIVEGVNLTLDSVIEPINEAGEVLGVMATGDLTARMVGEYKGDLSKLKEDINKLGDSLTQLLTQVADAVQTSASSAIEISSTAESLAAATQEQSAQADEVASAVEEMSRTVTENAMSANKTAEMAQANGQIAKEGGVVVSQTVSKMRDIATVVKNSADNIQKLGESSKQIGEIISVIDDIADQTNLLALNAAIEAARAGEQGRGFAVVADEVRKLAERTTEATKQIASMIKGIQSETEAAVVAMNRGNEEVKSGIELADRAGASLQQILTSTQEVLDMINQIAAASEEQSATSEQISKNVVSISKVTSESAGRVEGVARTAEELARLTEQLQILMSKFSVDDSSHLNPSRAVSGRSNRHLPASAF